MGKTVETRFLSSLFTFLTNLLILFFLSNLDRLSDASEEIAAHSATIGGLEDQKPVSIPGRSDSRPSLRRMVSVAASPSVRAAVKKRISTDKPARPPVKATVSGGPKLESSKKSQPFSNLPSETARSIGWFYLGPIDQLIHLSFF